MTALTEPDAFQAIIIPAGSIMLLDGRDAPENRDGRPPAPATSSGLSTRSGRLMLEAFGSS